MGHRDRPCERMRKVTASDNLITRVNLALLAGRNLQQIEDEVLATSGLDDETWAVAWLYTWSYEDGDPRDLRVGLDT